MKHAVIIGTSVGGVRAAQALRREGFAGEITLVGVESDDPYDKPPLSKQFLAGDADTMSIALLSKRDAEEKGIELRLGSAATGLDVEGRVVQLEDGSEIGYDVLIVATGAAARPSPWVTDSGVHVLRSMSDAIALRTAMEHGGNVVVIGGGFIGAEVASTARKLGLVVDVVDPQPHPIERVVGATIAPHFSSLHGRHSTGTRFGVGVTSVDGCAGDLTVTLTTGQRLHASTVVVGIGAVPNVEWLEGSRVPLKDGVLCDEFGRVIGCSDLFAVGDVASWRAQGGIHSRIEHWTNAVEQAAVVAHNIVRPDDLKAHRPDRYVWSDQYDWKMQIVGAPSSGVPRHIVGNLEAPKAKVAVVYVDDVGDLAGGVTVNWPRASSIVRRAYAGNLVVSDLLDELLALPGCPPLVQAEQEAAPEASRV